VRVDADFIALSFVRSPDDIREARRLVEKMGGRQGIIAKLEKPEAIANLDEIIKESDGVMIARGDLGIELPPAEVPRIQRRVIRQATCYNRTVIVATQMLESMRSSPRPTRAEVTDVATAVFEHVDAVMLSAETATGRYPVETIRTMSKIIEEAEKEPLETSTRIDRLHSKSPIPLAVAEAVIRAHESCEARLIIAFTSSGFTAQLISNLSPPQPIVALTEDKRVMRRMSLVRSVYPVKVPQPQSFGDMIDNVNRLSRKHRLARKGQRVIITGGVPFGQRTPTNLLLIHEVQ
jgi:pyruvate kinase